MLELIDRLTRELMQAQVYIISETSGDISKDKKLELGRINRLRNDAGLFSLPVTEFESWPGELTEDR